jgi:integrase
VREIASGSQAAALTRKQASEALAAFERLQQYYHSTGRKVSLLGVVNEYAEAASKLDGHSLNDAVDKFLTTVATVKRMDLAKAVDQFIEARQRKTIAKEGKRPALSPEHHYLTSLWLREFGNTFPGYAVCDLTKEHLNSYMAAHAKAAPKTRNERRGVVKMLLKWCVEQDYLAPTHRLFEATELKHEAADPEGIDFYRPDELQAILDRASKLPKVPKKGEEPETDYRLLLPGLVLAGLAGMRVKEIMRLTWEDLFRVPGHIEVKALKAKTRSRRLIPACVALAQWIEPYRGRSGLIWTKSYDMFHLDFAGLRESLKIPNRRNGLRHAFVTYHFALHADEGLTSMQAGNSPQMVHKNYKGLATKDEAEKWFSVCPAGAAENVVPFPQKANR